MGLSGPVAVVILVAALLSQASVLLTAQRNAEARVEDGRESWNRRQEAVLAHAFAVTASSWDEEAKSLTLTLENQGRVTLAGDRLNLLLDGQWADGNVTSTTVDGNPTAVWPPGGVLLLEATWPAAPSDAAVVSPWGQLAVRRGL